MLGGIYLLSNDAEARLKEFNDTAFPKKMITITDRVRIAVGWGPVSYTHLTAVPSAVPSFVLSLIRATNSAYSLSVEHCFISPSL